MTMWGFLQVGIAPQAGMLAQAASTFLAAFLLWDILFRGQLGFSMSFLEEMWSRNLPNLMISPLRPFEFVLQLIIMGTVRMAFRTSAFSTPLASIVYATMSSRA